ncbi:MerR family transcriptional regulator [Kitasatospora viridis]|uniref:MerR family transcriptional regulator n=1 Tax=Kitasatospora viridis TaxID=281105 RepID=UPI0011A22866|nr:MerR family transcriptional regulator [Kitasatospora viridis]
MRDPRPCDADHTTIGTPSREDSAGPRLLRHHEEQGLPAAERSPGGHRRYSADAPATARRIRTLPAAGLPAGVIRQVLPASRVWALTCSPASPTGCGGSSPVPGPGAPTRSASAGPLAATGAHRAVLRPDGATERDGGSGRPPAEVLWRVRAARRGDVRFRRAAVRNRRTRAVRAPALCPSSSVPKPVGAVALQGDLDFLGTRLHHSGSR